MTLVMRPLPDGSHQAEVDGITVGTAGMRWWDESDGTRLYLLTGSVDPEHQGRGYGRRILAWQEEQVRALDHPKEVVPVLGANVESPAQERLIQAAGYEVAFTRVRMELSLDEPRTAGVPAGLEVRPASARDHRVVYDANAEVFGGSGLGHVQDSFEEFEQEIAEDYPDHGLWTLAWDGDELAGWVISGLDDTPWVGVRPAWRRRGLATTLLRANHQALWDRGARTASLWTVLENPTGSVALYESLGYRITVRQPRYRKT